MSAKPLDRTPTRRAILTSEILGCAFIMLGHGRFALIDRSDLESVSQFIWTCDGRYAKRKIGSYKARKVLYLHRFLMGDDGGPEIDHVNRDRLDYRRANLRFCTASQNRANTLRRKHNMASPYKGVRPSTSGTRFQARGVKGGREEFIGTFPTEPEAAQAYNKWALANHGEFACLNVI